MSPSMCPIRRTIASAARLRTATGPSAGIDSTATPWVGLTWAITGRLAVCSGRSVTHTTSDQPRARSMPRPAEISELRSVGGSTSRSETNSTFHRAPGSCAASRSAMSGSRLSVNSEAGPGDASKPTTRSGCCEVAGKLAADVSTLLSAHVRLAIRDRQEITNDCGLLLAPAELPVQRRLRIQGSQPPRRPGAASPRLARSSPKSVSADTRTRFSRSASAMICSSDWPPRPRS